MTKRVITLPAPLVAMLWLAGATPQSFAQDATAPPATSETPERWEEALNRIEKLRANVKVNDKPLSLEFSKKPVLTFSDPTRKENAGTVWLIGTEGRPKAILSLFFNSADDFWSYEFTSLSSDSIDVRKEKKWGWKPLKSGLTVNEIAKGERPAESAALRLSQMKAIARAFSAAEVYFDGSRTELRLLPQPIHRYSDDQGIVDGALFALAHGTNPEILLLIECIKNENNDINPWRYGAARLSSAELHLEHQQKEVWTIDAVRKDANTDPYYSYREATMSELPVK